ncbi:MULTISPECIES: hypothetical protein [Eisenbergiella]|uniref:hypothetical protein n=1 Tax=Eisenbergiella TaxID=1432051 RepID=UPI0023F1DDC9|nr:MULTISPECIES: hypothetical protein [Eisenbergiella]MCI6710167.1 hypothetical protein [Eisenbergiella massiliensis]MDY5529341.1 hypothetical protein [Eisenbergiella porci]
MTVIESIIQFLGMYERENRIGVDKLESQAASYSLMKAPQENVQRFISGMEIHTDYYQLMARLDAQSEQERIANNAWGQGITEWIGQKNEAKQFPVLDGYRCTGISVSTPFYMGMTDKAGAVYQMTIAIEYVKEKKA